MSHEVLNAGNTEALGPELRMEGGVAGEAWTSRREE